VRLVTKAAFSRFSLSLAGASGDRRGVTLRHSILVAVAVALIGSTPGLANISFNINYSSDVTGLANFSSVQSAVNYVANEYSTLYSNNITLYITVGCFESAGNCTNSGLGGSSTNLIPSSYAAIRAGLVADSDDPVDASFDASLPATDPIGGTHDWWVPCAESKALSLGGCGTGAGADGEFDFNALLSYTFDPNNRAVSGEFDFIGVAEHEFSEIMGRIFGLGASIGGAPSYLPNDLDRFTGAGTRSFANCQLTTTSGIYLSANNGTTNVTNFNNNSGGDCDDYDGTVATDPYNAFTGTDQAHALNAADDTNMEILGYDLAAPEPSTFVLVGAALLGAGFLRHRLQARNKA
jgi:hypothetical protein